MGQLTSKNCKYQNGDNLVVQSFKNLSENISNKPEFVYTYTSWPMVYIDDPQDHDQ